MYRQSCSLFSGFLTVVVMLAGAQAYSGEDPAAVSSPEVVELKVEAGSAFSAAFFLGGRDHAAVFVPGAVFDKESWYFLAERLQALNTASLSLDAKTPDAVWAAVDFLKGEGFKHVVLVGGSMGGTAVLDALEKRSEACVSRIVLLAPAGGAPVASSDINKLFIVAKEDRLGLYASVKNLYEQSSDPKTFAGIEGSAHAQHLFKTAQHEFLCEWIIGFITEDE